VRLLLDTHALLWWLADEGLSTQARDAIADPATLVAVSAVSAFIGTMCTKPENDETLIKFYKNVRPWGWWGRIRDLVLESDPSFQPNRDCARNWVNIVVGIVWQLSIFTTPIYLVTRNWQYFWPSLAVFAATITFLKFNWYDKLEKDPVVPVLES